MQNDILLKHLSTIIDPELGVDIVELGMVKNISFVESTVLIKLALTIAECPMRNQIETEIKRKLLLMENVDTVEIEVTAMSKKDRSSVMEKARKKADIMHQKQKLIRKQELSLLVVVKVELVNLQFPQILH